MKDQYMEMDETKVERGLENTLEQIRETDLKIRDLFVDRMKALSEVARWKRERGIPVEDMEAETRFSEGLGESIEEESIRSFYLSFLKDMNRISSRWQHCLMEGVRVAYSGVEGAFAHIAAMQIFPDGVKVAFSSFEDAYHAVEEGDCDIAVLPIENSYAGEVGQVLDLMFTGSLHVNGVYDLPVTHNLLGLPGAQTEDIRTVISHPQALAQCGPYLKRHGIETQEASNTAVAAREVLERRDLSVGAIASAYTARLSGLHILDHDINASHMNTTRFAVFSRVENAPASGYNSSVNGHEKNAFLILFTVKDEVGGLAKAINLISACDYNMRILRSRPMHNLPWHYYFYAEVEGDDSTENGQRLLRSLKAVCPVMRVVGRYRAGAAELSDIRI